MQDAPTWRTGLARYRFPHGCDHECVSTSTTPPQPPADTSSEGRARRALADAVREIEHHVATAGWDAPVRVFALVRTQDALAAEPGLADQLSADVLAAARADDQHLTSVEQEGLPSADDLEQLLGGLTWPPTVHGAAVTVERVVLPPGAEDDLPADPEGALAALLAHPQRQDVRLAVGVLRDGPSWCAVRTRAHDSDDAVGQGPDLVPGLVEAVRATLA